MKKTVLLTRPRASSERWARLLQQRGFDSVIEPLLTISPTHAPRPAGDFQAIIITSVNAPDTLDMPRQNVGDLLPLPCFCVGASTGAAARAAGFSDVRCGVSDSAALAQMIVENIGDKSRPLLHIAGDIVDAKAQEILTRNGFTVTSWNVYSAEAAEDFTALVRAGFKQGAFDAIPVFSPRSARLLVSLIEKNRLIRACHGISAIALSQAVADMLQTLPWRQLRIAASPSEEDVLACLQSVLTMSQTENTLAPQPAPRRRKRKYLGALLLGLIVIGTGAAAIKSSKFMPLMPQAAPGGETEKSDNAPAVNTTPLERRIAILEARLDALSETPPAPVATGDNIAATQNVKNLETRLAQVENQNRADQQMMQRLAVASFAFWDMREAAREGQNFTAPLEALRKVAPADNVVGEQTARLQPYAAAGAPDWAALRAGLIAAEAAAPVADDADTSIWGRIKKLVRPLISVQKLHDPSFAAIEKAVDQRDAAAALAAVKILPAGTQQALAGWTEQIQARATIDDALRILDSHFIAPPAATPDGKP